MIQAKHLWLFFLVAFPIAVYGQDAPTRKSVAVFSLGHYQWQVPGGALSTVDEQIQDIFIGFGKYDVMAVPYRLDADGTDQLVALVRQTRQEDAPLPEQARLGQEVIDDFPVIAETSFVVIPLMSDYELDESQDEYNSKLEVTFIFVDMVEAEEFGRFALEANASSDTAQGAVQAAASKIVDALVLELAKHPEFQTRAGIIEMRRRSVFLGFGENAGAKTGDEYVIVSSGPSEDDRQVESGLLILDDVKEEISIATLLYSEDGLDIGDQLKAIQRKGFDTSAKIRMVIARDGLIGTIGVRQSIYRGLLTYRPFLGIDVPISFSEKIYLPGILLRVYGGGEINWYLWRFQFVPSAGVGFATSIPIKEEESFQVSHAGGFAEFVTTYLLNQNLKLSFTVGFSAWFGLSPTAGDSYLGPVVGFGATYKY